MIQLSKNILVLAIGGAVIAQGRGRPTPLPRALDDGAGLQQVDGQLIGGGRDYKAYFSTDGVEFVPMLGPVAARNMPLELRAVQVGREGSLAPLDKVPPEHAALTVRYEHPQCAERYELRPEGMEQSFVFDGLPAGSGDLVVQCGCRTDLPLVAAEGEETVRFFEAGIGGIAIGAVTGIDAEGDSVRGTATWENGKLELRLPDEFVESAKLPLVLDPVVSARTLDRGPLLRFRPSVASLPGKWLVAYQVLFSGNDSDIRGRIVDASTLGLSSILQIATTNNVVEQTPDVGAVAMHDRFLVVYQKESPPLGLVYLRIVGSNGTVGSRALLSGQNSSCTNPSISGAARRGVDEAVAVWADHTQNAIRGIRIRTSPTGFATLGSVTLHSAISGTRVGSPNIQQARGEFSRRLVAFTVDTTSGIGGTGVRVLLLASDLTVLDARNLEAAGRSNDHDLPEVDGDGWRWVVAYERETSSGDSDVVCRSLRFLPSSGGSLSVSGAIPVASGSTDAFDATVALLGRGCLVGWTNTNIFGDFGSAVGSFDMDSCNVCEGRFTVVDVRGRAEHAPQMATAFDDSGRPLEQALLAVERRSQGTFTGGIWAYSYEAVDGEQEVLGMPCGGLMSAPCALVGNSRFRFGVLGVPTNSTVFLVLSLDRLGLGCGGCVLVPNPFSGWVLAATTDGSGSAWQPAPIPPVNELRGFGVYAQWIYPSFTAFCTSFVFPGLSMSDGQLIRIQ